MRLLVLFKTTIRPLLIWVPLACFALSPRAQAVSPAPDGGYSGGNTAEGADALLNLSSGIWNTALGFEALNHDTAGKINTATGVRALFSNTSGSYNTANGVYALYGNTIGWYNNAVGAYALSNNTTGFYNTANGYAALYRNTEGDGNTANGYAALYNTTTGGFNTASGIYALRFNTTGFNNTASGNQALQSNTIGTQNTANGAQALFGNITGSNNTALGEEAGSNLTTGDNNIDIGYNVFGVAGESNTIRIGNADITDTYIRGISGQTASGGAAVFVNSNGKLGTMTSSARFKDEIKPMGRVSEAILALRPVSFRYKREIDPQGIPEFGLVAEEVEKVNPDLIIRDPEGKAYTVRYEQINAMLLNEFLKEHRKVEELKKDFQATVAQQQKEIQALTAQLKEQAAQIQKVSGRLEVNKPTPKVVLNNP
jgi:hypothetical protein